MDDYPIIGVDNNQRSADCDQDGLSASFERVGKTKCLESRATSRRLFLIRVYSWDATSSDGQPWSGTRENDTIFLRGPQSTRMFSFSSNI